MLRVVCEFWVKRGVLATKVARDKIAPSESGFRLSACVSYMYERHGQTAQRVWLGVLSSHGDFLAISLIFSLFRTQLNFEISDLSYQWKKPPHFSADSWDQFSSASWTPILTLNLTCLVDCSVVGSLSSWSNSKFSSHKMIISLKVYSWKDSLVIYCLHGSMLKTFVQYFPWIFKTLVNGSRSCVSKTTNRM